MDSAGLTTDRIESLSGGDAKINSHRGQRMAMYDMAISTLSRLGECCWPGKTGPSE
ncbi:MAG: hypothetical protein U0587_15470 [Candidatus Binatia bacterium]